MKEFESLTLNPSYKAPSSWWEHVPIAHWLVENLKPEKIVELGTHYGVSFFSFCEAAEKFSPKTFVYAIDTWEGDAQAGSYGEEVYIQVKKHSGSHHKLRSELIRSKFNEAAKYFEKNTLDLIHIDGLHTYESVKEDFETWLPKLVSGGSIILHDWNVRERNFGVWKLWDEIKSNPVFQCIETPNGHGLAIATLSKNKPDWHSQLEEILPALVSRGGLLSKLQTKSEDIDLLKSKNIELTNHISNLEWMKKEKEKELIELKHENNEYKNKEILEMTRRKSVRYLIKRILGISK